MLAEMVRPGLRDLLAALRAEDGSAISLFLDRGGDVQLTDAHGNNALHCLVDEEMEEAPGSHQEPFGPPVRNAIRLALELGVNPNARNDDAFTPMDWADGGHQAAVELLGFFGGKRGRELS